MYIHQWIVYTLIKKLKILKCIYTKNVYTKIKKLKLHSLYIHLKRIYKTQKLENQ